MSAPRAKQWARRHRRNRSRRIRANGAPQIKRGTGTGVTVFSSSRGGDMWPALKMLTALLDRTAKAFGPDQVGRDNKRLENMTSRSAISAVSRFFSGQQQGRG